MRSRPLIVLAVLAAASPALAAQAPAPPPTLVVHLTVDQLRPDYLERWRPQLVGGLRMLVEEGAFFTRASLDHAITETAPGHASTLSGRFPYSTGIASNSAGVNTPDAPLVGATGTGASPFRFVGTTLADWMTVADPRTRVLSASRKDRGAILPVGRGRHQVFWYASAGGRFVTSRWYGDSLPTWVQAFNAEDRVARSYAGRTWSLLLDDASYPEPDTVPAEGGGGRFVFPYALPREAERAQREIIGTPWMDELTLDFVWRGVQTLQLGRGPQTDLLAISLSSTDAVGHQFGPDSREVHDQVLRLDRALGAFFDSLFAHVPRASVVVTLTADHGVAPAPEVRSRWGDNAGAVRYRSASLGPAFDAMLPAIRRSGIDPDAFSFDWPVLLVDRRQAEGKDAEVRAVARAFAGAARRIGGVHRVDVIEDAARADTVRDAIARRWLHMFPPGGDAIAAVTLAPFSVIGDSPGEHGSPHDYDARVPVLFWGAAFQAAHDDGIARVVDIAPTLAALLGVRPAERLDGVVLRRAFRPPAR